MTKELIEQSNKELLVKIQEICKELYPNFDTIQIFATKHDGNEYGTTQFTYGLGNFFARYGQVLQWLKNEDIHIDEDEE